ncbi:MULTISPECIES: nuclear transport factor 2 family protein [unclassified Amycolatopsis]|uniref:nuclear transport factor 2 family protein n=1 Tax=unclassified Amycolatopsis TaxID=2618356 RepID=UPI002874F748|nr:MULTISPECIES: nuclear transport factor 2 family protein [unclassified Amycolatopsis]MDS0139880.1 nuclear transport factor 2 family protein [Amycolatopsis sp. 505]MDS0148208.1 nuclear transport factor 2 family protein [Amycolatopsis sp. CM201R]
MTASENKQLLKTAFDAWATGDIRPLLAAMADDVTWTVGGHNSWSGTFRGKDSVRRDLLGPLGAQFEGTYTSTASRFVAEDDVVVVETQGSVATKAGARYDNKYCFVFRVEDGRIREITEYMDTQLVAEVLPELAR